MGTSNNFLKLFDCRSSQTQLQRMASTNIATWHVVGSRHRLVGLVRLTFVYLSYTLQWTRFIVINLHAYASFIWLITIDEYSAALMMSGQTRLTDIVA